MKKLVLNKRQITDLSEIQLQSVAGGDEATCSSIGSCFFTIQLSCYCSPPLSIECSLP